MFKNIPFLQSGVVVVAEFRKPLLEIDLPSGRCIYECMDALLDTICTVLPSEAKVVPSTLNKFHMRGLSLHARICILF
jgi:hypothetical protein